MDFPKLARLIAGGGVMGLLLALVKPAELALDGAGVAVMLGFILAALYTIGAFLAPSPVCETEIREKDPE